MHHNRGFTLVELIAVLILIGILSTVVIPRFLTRDGFSEYAVRDQVIAAARLAQQRAMYDHAAGACYRVVIASSVLSVQDAASNLIGPNQEWLAGIAIEGVADTSIAFSPLGSPLDTADCSGSISQRAISVMGESTLNICLYSSGFISPEVCE